MSQDSPAPEVPAVEQPPKLCRSAWWDGKSGHICGELAGHDGPHRCHTDNAVYGQKPVVKEDPARRYGYFPG